MSRCMTMGELRAKLDEYAKREDWQEVAGRDVTVRVANSEGHCIVGGLTHADLDFGCTDFESLVLDGDQDADGQPLEDE